MPFIEFFSICKKTIFNFRDFLFYSLLLWKDKEKRMRSKTIQKVRRSTLSPASPSPVISRPGADGHSSTHYPVGVEEVGKCTRKQIRVSLRFLVCQGTEKASS